MNLRTLGLAAVLALGVGRSLASTLTFDEIDAGTGTQLSNGYFGLDWNNFYVLNAPNYTPASGYLNGMVSPENVAFNGFGNDASFSMGSGTFTLTSFYATAAWQDGLTLRVLGRNDGANLYSESFTLDSFAPTKLTFNWAGIDEVYIATANGVENPDYSGDGKHVAFDNLVINGDDVTPGVPGPAAALAFGLGALARRRRK